MSDEQMPKVLTVEEAAKLLRIGRTSAYQLAQRWEATNGADGLPVIRVGHLLRVPVPALERRLGGPLDSERVSQAGPEPAELSRPVKSMATSSSPSDDSPDHNGPGRFVPTGPTSTRDSSLPAFEPGRASEARDAGSEAHVGLNRTGDGTARRPRRARRRDVGPGQLSLFASDESAAELHDPVRENPNTGSLRGASR